MAGFCRFVRQQCSTTRLIVVLVTAIVLLQVVHLFLLSLVETRTKQSKVQKPKPPISLKRALHRPRRLSLGLDSSGNYQVLRFLISSENIAKQKTSRKDDVTIVTQCSVNNLHHLQVLAERWIGPISVAIFSPKPKMKSVYLVILHLRKCFPAIRQHVSFHLVHPLGEMKDTVKAESLDFTDDDSMDLQVPCNEVLEWVENFQNFNQNYVDDVPYPNNLLRNVAWQGSGTDYVFVIDIDMLPSLELRVQFTEFILLKKQTMQWDMEEPQNQVYVLPAFEIDMDASNFPKYRTELIELWDKGDVRPFYQELCWKCQKHSNYTKWKGLNVPAVSGRKLNIAYEVEWKDPWEPFYIANRNIPKYDERFKQYGFNRISQVCEVHIAGYNFAIVDNGFVLHKGFKNPGGFHVQKDKDNERNRILFRQFKEELQTKYPESLRRC
ncbi:beta-1,4-glucuronyltransferase 1-like [Glandiceps talaboti]